MSKLIDINAVQPQDCVTRWTHTFIHFHVRTSGEQAYQFRVLPVGLQTAQRVFLTCMQATLSIIRLPCLSSWALEFVTQWFSSYPEGRSYQVTWRGSTPTPQGSVLGSTSVLFLYPLSWWCYILPWVSIPLLCHRHSTHPLLSSFRHKCTDLSMSGRHLNMDGSSSAKIPAKLSCFSSQAIHSHVRILRSSWRTLQSHLQSLHTTLR